MIKSLDKAGLSVQARRSQAKLAVWNAISQLHAMPANSDQAQVRYRMRQLSFQMVVIELEDCVKANEPARWAELYAQAELIAEEVTRAATSADVPAFTQRFVAAKMATRLATASRLRKAADRAISHHAAAHTIAVDVTNAPAELTHFLPAIGTKHRARWQAKLVRRVGLAREQAQTSQETEIETFQ